MPYNYPMNPGMQNPQNPYAMQNPYISQAPSPYQQSMMGGGSPYAQPLQAPRDTSFSDRQAAIGQQLAGQAGQNAQATTAGMSGGLGGAIGGGGMDPKMLAAGLKKFGGAINPYMPGTQQATANQFGTDPYSEQSLMLAKQNQGLM